MNLQEAQLLLQKYRIAPNKLLGQNFMVDFSLFPKLSNYADLNRGDVTLDAGAGFGFLTQFMAGKCKSVVAVEKDPQVTTVLREQVKNLTNVTVIEGDVLHTIIPSFNKAVSLPPYYLSSQLVIWLIDRGFERAILVVQKEFAEKLVASAGSEEYGWLNVVTCQYAEVEVLDDVPKWMFYPQPEVDSAIMRLKPWMAPPFVVKDPAFFRRLTKWLFTQRNKKLGNAIMPFLRNECRIDKASAEKLASSLTVRDRRARDLSPEEFGELANALIS